MTAAPHQRKKIQEILTRIEKDLQQVPLSDAELTQLETAFPHCQKMMNLLPMMLLHGARAIERLIKNRESLEDFNRYEEILESIRPEDVQRGFQTLVQQRHWLFLAE